MGWEGERVQKMEGRSTVEEDEGRRLHLCVFDVGGKVGDRERMGAHVQLCF